MGVMILFSAFMNILVCSVKTQLARLLKTLSLEQGRWQYWVPGGEFRQSSRAVSVLPFEGATYQARHVGPGTDSDPYRMTKHYLGAGEVGESRKHI